MSNVNEAIKQMSEEELCAVDAAVAVIQQDCSYCSRDVTMLLRSIAKDLLITGQVILRCRKLPDEDRTKQDCIAMMMRQKQDILQWDDIFHERSRSVCRLCQEGTRKCVEIWQLAKRL